MFDDVRAAITYLFPGFLAYALLYRRLVPARGEADLVLTVKCVICSLGINALVGVPGAYWHYKTDWTHPGTIAFQFALAVVAGVGAGLAERRWGVLGRVWHKLGALGVGLSCARLG